MGTDHPNQAVLTRLLPDTPSRTLTAEEVVQELRLWEELPAPAGRTRRPGLEPSPERPYVLLNMACTADGRATIEGRSGPIGNRADRELFHGLRTAVDAVLVGAGTLRAERYRGLVRDEHRRGLRTDRGLAAEPLACIVSASLDLSDVPLLADPAARVAILTPSPGRPPESVAHVECIRTMRDDGRLDLAAALRELRARHGVRTVLCEGGPHLSAELLALGLVDELFLSFAPKLAGGGAGDEPLRILAGPELRPPVELELLAALESESQLLLRYRVESR